MPPTRRSLQRLQPPVPLVPSNPLSHTEFSRYKKRASLAVSRAASGVAVLRRLAGAHPDLRFAFVRVHWWPRQTLPPPVISLKSYVTIKKQTRSIDSRMALAGEAKTKVISQFRVHKTDTGSPEVQVAILSRRISGADRSISRSHEKDHHSRRGLLQMVARRRRLLDYLRSRSPERYKTLITESWHPPLVHSESILEALALAAGASPRETHSKVSS